MYNQEFLKNLNIAQLTQLLGSQEICGRTAAGSRSAKVELLMRSPVKKTINIRGSIYDTQLLKRRVGDQSNPPSVTACKWLGFSEVADIVLVENGVSCVTYAQHALRLAAIANSRIVVESDTAMVVIPKKTVTWYERVAIERGLTFKTIPSDGND